MGFYTHQNIMMAKSNRITKTLTDEQISLVHQLDQNEISIFSVEDLPELLNIEIPNLNELVENLEHKEFLMRLERGTYCRSTFRDENVIGTFLVDDGAIAYWSALNLHGLTEQFSNTIYVQTTHRKLSKVVLGTPYQFVKIKDQKRVGISYNGYGNYKYAITDVEKTIIDCFDLPQYCGGYAELIRAFATANLNAQKLIQYCDMVANIAVTKRLGYLSSLLQKVDLEQFTAYALTKVNTTYSQFDPLGTNTGSFNSQWRLRLNITEQDILLLTQKQY